MSRTCWILAGLLGFLFASCSDNQGALEPPRLNGDGGSSEPGAAGSSGSTSCGSTHGESAAGGEAGAASEAGAAGASGGVPIGGSGGTTMSCIYSANVPQGDGGETAAAGAAGADGLAAGIGVRSSPFGGLHLTDSEGRTLYTFGADLPGDCEDSPVVSCDANCQTSWPPFSDAANALDPALGPAAFGSTLYMAGDPPMPKRVSTYYGWPLYYYAEDNSGTGSVPKWTTAGAGVAKLWHVAKVRPPNVVILRYRVDATTTSLYLGNGSGMTLYAHANDTSGGAPQSACTGDCLGAFAPLSTHSISAVSSLDASDLSLFVRADDGTLQVAYKGAPLYTAAVDQKPGDRLGVETDLWSLVNP